MAVEEKVQEQRSHINGSGHGDTHCWECLGTLYRRTKYRCRDCGVEFLHDYPNVTGIYTAMFQCGVPAECKANGETP